MLPAELIVVRASEAHSVARAGQTTQVYPDPNRGQDIEILLLES